MEKKIKFQLWTRFNGDKIDRFKEFLRLIDINYSTDWVDCDTIEFEIEADDINAFLIKYVLKLADIKILEWEESIL